MKKGELPRYLVSGEFVVAKPNGDDRERAAARRVFIAAMHQLVPEFFETLHEDVYSVFARRVAAKTRIPLQPWKIIPDELGFRLLNWTARFNVDRENWILDGGEDWILDGALATLWHWHRSPQSRKTLDWSAFRRFVAEPGLKVPPFSFASEGWDRTFIRGDAFAAGTTKAFQAELTKYIQEERKRAREQGLRPARRYTPEHFEWLVLFQCGKLSLDAILRRYNELSKAKAGSATISKGMRRAASGWTRPPPSP
jgi:hypothetical protein